VFSQLEIRFHLHEQISHVSISTLSNEKLDTCRLHSSIFTENHVQCEVCYNAKSVYMGTGHTNGFQWIHNDWFQIDPCHVPFKNVCKYLLLHTLLKRRIRTWSILVQRSLMMRHISTPPIDLFKCILKQIHLLEWFVKKLRFMCLSTVVMCITGELL
jgi:hypothetical protein